MPKKKHWKAGVLPSLTIYNLHVTLRARKKWKQSVEKIEDSRLTNPGREHDVTTALSFQSVPYTTVVQQQLDTAQ
jgi:hypothetical protein